MQRQLEHSLADFTLLPRRDPVTNEYGIAHLLLNVVQETSALHRLTRKLREMAADAQRLLGCVPAYVLPIAPPAPPTFSVRGCERLCEAVRGCARLCALVRGLDLAPAAAAAHVPRKVCVLSR